MKKFLLLAVAALFGIAVNAQVLQSGGAVHAEKLSPKSAPAKVCSLEGTSVWGYYLKSDLDGVNCIGFNQAATYTVFMKIPGTGVLTDALIQGVNYPVYDPSVMSDISVSIYDTDKKNVLWTKTISPAELEELTYKSILLDEPILIDRDLYLSTTFTTVGTSQSAKYPILIDGDKSHPAGGLILEGTDYTSQFGAYCGQIFVSNLKLNDAAIHFTGSYNTLTAAGKECTFDYTLVSDGSLAVTDIDYDIEVAGVKESRHAKVNIAAGLNKTLSFPVTFTSPEELGSYEVKLSVTKVNGIENSQAGNVLVNTFNNVKRLATRRTLVEEFTGTGCPWCTRGWAGMELLKKLRPDNFIGIAIHQYNASDPMYFPYYNSPDFTGAPQCTIDRSAAVDPYYGSENYENGILGDFDEANKVPCFVDVNVTASYTDKNLKEIDAKATVDFMQDAHDYRVAFALTADGVSGSTGWNQGNNYANYSPSQAGVLAEDTDGYLAQFCRGAKYGKSSVSGLVFGDVLIGASFKVEGNYLYSTATELPAQISADSVVESTTQLSLPTSTACTNKNANPSIVNAINPEEVYVVAIVYDENMGIANAARCKVSYPEGIDTVLAPTATDAAAYDLSGRVAPANAKGLLIEGGKKVIR